jgi:hypothetical protein
MVEHGQTGGPDEDMCVDLDAEILAGLEARLSLEWDFEEWARAQDDRAT